MAGTLELSLEKKKSSLLLGCWLDKGELLTVARHNSSNSSDRGARQ